MIPLYRVKIKDVFFPYVPPYASIQKGKRQIYRTGYLYEWVMGHMST